MSRVLGAAGAAAGGGWEVAPVGMVEGLLAGPLPDGASGRAPVLIKRAGEELRLDRWFGSMTGPDDRTGLGWRESSA